MGKLSSLRRSISVDLPTPDGPERTNTSPLAGVSVGWWSPHYGRMSFDALTLAAVRDELAPLLTGARMQKLVFVDELSLAVECLRPGHGRTNLLLSADLGHGRVQRLAACPPVAWRRDTPVQPARPQAPAQRAHSRGSPAAAGARVRAGLRTTGRLRPALRVLLIVEAMGRRSNLVLVDEDGLILDAARRTPPSRNPRRPVLPHLPYEPPPPQDRLLPEAISADALASAREPAGRPGEILSDDGGPVAAGRPRAGVSRHRQRPTRRSATVDWHDRRDGGAGVHGDGRDRTTGSPTLAFDADERPVAFAPYVLTHLAATGAHCQSVRFDQRRDRDVLRAAGEAARPAAAICSRPNARRCWRRWSATAQTLDRRIAALEHQLDARTGAARPTAPGGRAASSTHQARHSPGADRVDAGRQRIELDRG